MAPLDDLFQLLWRDYSQITPVAKRVQDILRAKGEAIVNDHIAFRTFDDERVDISVLERVFVDGGYQAMECYEFPRRKLVAYHYEHEREDYPRLFISQLELGQCSDELAGVVRSLVDQVPAGLCADWRFPACGRPWKLSHENYKKLLAESEYAAWVAAFGFRANHFTVSLNHLQQDLGVRGLCDLLEQENIALNREGGLVKGSAGRGLEQGSTLADLVPVPFEEGEYEIPGCYYEFAHRHPGPEGEIFSGFLQSSAANIFASTDVKVRGD